MNILEPSQSAWATIIVVHGIGEHSGRYQALSEWLAKQGLRVCRYDHYGHGQASGKRGSIEYQTQLREDLLCHVRALAERYHEPLLLLGHSMGGLIVLDAALSDGEGISGVIALSPAIRVTANPLQRWLLPVLRRILPNISLPTMLPPSGISHDPAVVAAYAQDPLVHDRITPTLAHYILNAGARVLKAAQHWQLPTLLLYAGADQLVDPTGSGDFLERASKDKVRGVCFPEAYHELHHEPDTTEFYTALEHWLGAHRNRLQQRDEADV
ncbi:lysophospholipase [Suttonella sp. R2A3]|uniref:alpha/beta hydrolase n=1 Tax=Suttonella sp. R2A3 TaxID=2908648 RepID=UPI001F3BB10E|nr:alpha/beta hydrolase [Suttonella sp. R2A3]UJF24641.1 lysophospholipase [Suttonella sp. R2A3]